MVRNDIIEKVDDIISNERGEKDKFGGVKIIMVGEMFKINNVIKEDFFREI